MSFSMAKKFVKQNLLANRLLEIPFVLSSGIMLMLFNIMTSLLKNDYVLNRHDSLPDIILIGVFILAVFSFIFVQYATNFQLKRRNKEFALYAVLGLEKKHIGKIISIEFFVLFVIVWIISIIGGYIFGQLSFLFLNFLMRDVAGRLMDYPFSMHALLNTTILVTVLYIVTVIKTGLRIYVSTPVELLEKGHRGECEQKSENYIMIAGFVLLFIGYGIALFVEGLLSSMMYFFIAVMATIGATYLLYVTFSAFVLKLQKKSKSFYTPKKFLSISGLLYRMRGNAISLASITVLCTGVILSIATTVTIYSNIWRLGNSIMPREYHIAAAHFEKDIKEMRDILMKRVESTVSSPDMIKNVLTAFNIDSVAIKEGDRLMAYKEGVKSEPKFVIGMDLAGYNERTKQNIELEENELLLCESRKSKEDIKNLIIGDKTFKIKRIENFVSPEYVALDAYGIVAKDAATLKYINEILGGPEISCSVDWDVEGVLKEEYEREIEVLSKQYVNFNFFYLRSRTKEIRESYRFNGGFLFLGVLIGIIFLTGAILITYYKQISEGYEDREKYQIMKKLGLSDNLIRKTTASQIGWMFYAPLIVAAIHCIVASKIIFRLLRLFGVGDASLYMLCLCIVIAVFAVIYFIIFGLTSRVYTKIVE